MTRNRTILISAVVAAAALFGYWHFLLGPKRDEAAKLSSDIAAKQAAVAQAESTVAEYARLKGTYPRNYATLVRLGKAVPGDDDVRSLLVQIAGTAHHSNVSFRKISVGSDSAQPTAATGAATDVPPGATALQGGVSQMPFSFNFTGSFHNLGGFLYRLERYVRMQQDSVAVTGRLLRVETLDLTPSGNGYPTLSADVSANSYLAEPPKPPAAVTPAGGAAGTPGTQASTPGGTAPSTTTATVTGAIR